VLQLNKGAHKYVRVYLYVLTVKEMGQKYNICMKDNSNYLDMYNTFIVV